MQKRVSSIDCQWTRAWAWPSPVRWRRHRTSTSGISRCSLRHIWVKWIDFLKTDIATLETLITVQFTLFNYIDISMLQNEMINFHITGAPQINYETLIPLTIIYSLFLVIGILGNLATCIVILSNEYLRYKSIYRNVVTRKMYLAFRTLLSSSPH